MTDNPQTKQTPDVQSADIPSSGNPSPGDHSVASGCRSGDMMGCGMGKKGFKGLLLMAACCGVPVLLFLVLPLAGSALGAFGVSALNTLAVLACPVGMALMMWMMMRGQRTETLRDAETQLVAASQTTSMAPSGSQEAAFLEDVLNPVHTPVTPASLSQEDVSPPLTRVNGQQTKRLVRVANGSQVTESRGGGI